MKSLPGHNCLHRAPRQKRFFSRSVYISAVTGTGKTKIAFIFQVVTIMVYLLYLYWLSHCVHAPLAVYMTTEYLFVIMLGIQSVIYLKRKHY